MSPDRRRSAHREEIATRIVKMRSAKTHLARLVREAVGDKAFIGVEPPPPGNRLGFLSEQFQVPDDFDTMCADEIQAMFEDRRIAGREEEQRTVPPDPS